VRYTKKPEDLFNDPEIEAIAIAAPAVMHYAFARQALEAGKDVFVEKPLALRVEEGESLVQIARARNKILMVGHLLQYHPAMRALYTLARSGELGNLRYLYSNRLNIGKLRTEENVLWSFAPHDISIMLSMVGEEPKEVHAWGGAYVSEAIHDTTLTLISFQNSIKGHVFVSWLHPYKEQRFVVVGSKAMAVFDDCAENKLCLYPHTIEMKNGFIPIAHKAEHRVIEFNDAEPLKEELTHFLECVRERKLPRTDGEEGLRVLRVLQRAQESLIS